MTDRTDLVASAAPLLAVASLLCGGLAIAGTRVLPSHEAVFGAAGGAALLALGAVTAAAVSLSLGTEAKGRAWTGGALGCLVLLPTGLVAGLFLLMLGGPAG